MNFQRGGDPIKSMSIGASESIIPKMIKDFIASDKCIKDVHVYFGFFVVGASGYFTRFRIWKAFRKSGLNKYVGHLFRKKDDRYYFIENPDYFYLFKLDEEYK